MGGRLAFHLACSIIALSVPSQLAPFLRLFRGPSPCESADVNSVVCTVVPAVRTRLFTSAPGTKSAKCAFGKMTDQDADDVRGGPNGVLSLKQARLNLMNVETDSPN